MEPGLIILGPSSLKLVPLAGCEDRDLLQIVSLATDVDSRQQGAATRLMQEVCRRADMSMLMLVVSPEPFGKRALDAKQLERWYEKFGFERIQDKPVMLCRDPKQRVYDIETDEFVVMQ